MIGTSEEKTINLFERRQILHSTNVTSYTLSSFIIEFRG